ncbi:hypothetical protein D9M71_612950 [compost metagenome]
MIGQDRLVVDKDGIGLLDVCQLHPGKEARGELSVRVVQRGARTNRSGLRVEDVVQEVRSTGMREALFVGQAHADGKVGFVRFLTSLRVVQEAFFVRIEVDVDGVDRDDPGQHRLVRDGQVAKGQLCGAHLAIDGRTHLGELHVQLRHCNSGLGFPDGSFAL